VSGQPAIRVADLVYRYPGRDRPAVDGMSFEVSRGEVFGFLGPSGAGKTTTQRAILGLVDGWSGTIEVLGRARGAWGADLFDRIGVAFELPVGYPRLTGREDLSHFANLHRRASRDAGELLEAVGLADVADVAVGAYSKGMRVRLNLARALLHQPDVLFLDEPTAGLDPVNARMVRDVIGQQRDVGRTVFVTTHDMVTADAVCDRVAFVVDGRIVACDHPRALRLEHGQPQVRVEHRVDGGIVTDVFPLGSASRRLVELLEAGTVETIHTAEATLDEVFTSVTGRAL
jgi:fluoroquinolone transport system ATP-binding protein